MTDEVKANIKYRLSDIGKQVGVLALEYISELEKENAELKSKNEKLYRTLDHLRESKNRKQKKIEEMQEGEVARFEVWHNRLTELERENAKLSEILNEAIVFIEQEDMQCKLCSFYLSCRVGDCTYKDEIPTYDIIREELEKRVKKELKKEK